MALSTMIGVVQRRYICFLLGVMTLVLLATGSAWDDQHRMLQEKGFDKDKFLQSCL